MSHLVFVKIISFKKYYIDLGGEKAAGCVSGCLGIWFRVERDFKTLIQRIEESEISMSSASIYIGANLLISIGAIIAIVGLLGAISVAKENEIMLAIVILFKFLINFILYIFIFLFNQQKQKSIPYYCSARSASILVALAGDFIELIS
mgnify:CR=1 FL=1